MKDPCTNCIVKPICGGNPLSANCCEKRLNYLSYRATKRGLIVELLFCSSKIGFLISLLSILIMQLMD